MTFPARRDQTLRVITTLDIVMRRIEEGDERAAWIRSAIADAYEVTGVPSDRVRRRSVMRQIMKSRPWLKLRPDYSRDCAEVRREAERLGIQCVKPGNRRVFIGIKKR